MRQRKAKFAVGYQNQICLLLFVSSFHVQVETHINRILFKGIIDLLVVVILSAGDGTPGSCTYELLGKP